MKEIIKEREERKKKKRIKKEFDNIFFLFLCLFYSSFSEMNNRLMGILNIATKLDNNSNENNNNIIKF